MKNIFKKAILPLLVFGIAIAGVFATNSSMVLDQPSQPVYTGNYYYHQAISNECIEIPKMDCTLINTEIVCTWKIGAIDYDVYAKLTGDDLLCTTQLFKRTIP